MFANLSCSMQALQSKVDSLQMQVASAARQNQSLQAAIAATHNMAAQQV
jgi:hypothetical protein